VAARRRRGRDSRCLVVPAPRPRPLIAAAPPPARVQVVALEFRFALSRQTIKAGNAIIELRNQGEDAHDLRLRRVGGTRVYALPLTQSGQTVDREFRLLPGTYRLYCSVANHRALGMQATLVVKQ
jgi:plastocyanin